MGEQVQTTQHIPFDPSLPSVRKVNIIDFIRTNYPHAVIPSKSTLADLRAMAKELMDAATEISSSDLTAQHSEEEPEERTSIPETSNVKKKRAPPTPSKSARKAIILSSPTRGRSLKKREPSTPSKSSKKVAISPSPVRGRPSTTSSRCAPTPSRISSKSGERTSRKKLPSGLVNQIKKKSLPPSSPRPCRKERSAKLTVQKKKVHSTKDPLSSSRHSVLKKTKSVKSHDRHSKLKCSHAATKEEGFSRKSCSTKKSSSKLETPASSVSGSETSRSASDSSEFSDHQDVRGSSNESSCTSDDISVSSESGSAASDESTSKSSNSMDDSDSNDKRSVTSEHKKNKLNRCQPQKTKHQSSKKKTSTNADRVRRVTFAKTKMSTLKSAMKSKKDRPRHSEIKKNAYVDDQPVKRPTSACRRMRDDDQQLDELEMGAYPYDSPNLKSNHYVVGSDDYGLDLDTSKSLKSPRKRKVYPYPGGHPAYQDFNESFFTPASLGFYSENPYRPAASYRNSFPAHPTFAQPSSTFTQPNSTFTQPSSTLPTPSSPFPPPGSCFPQPSSTFPPPTSTNSSNNFGQRTNNYTPISNNYAPSSSNYGSGSHHHGPSSNNYTTSAHASSNNYDPYLPVLFYNPANPNIPNKRALSPSHTPAPPHASTTSSNQPSRYSTTPYPDHTPTTHHSFQHQSVNQPDTNVPPLFTSQGPCLSSHHAVQVNPPPPHPPTSTSTSATTCYNTKANSFNITSQPSQNGDKGNPHVLFNNPYHQATARHDHPPPRITSAPQFSQTSDSGISRVPSNTPNHATQVPPPTLPYQSSSFNFMFPQPRPSITLTEASPPSLTFSESTKLTHTDEASQSATLAVPTTKSSERVVRSIKQVTPQVALVSPNNNSTPKPKDQPIPSHTLNQTSPHEWKEIAHFLADFLSESKHPNHPHSQLSEAELQRLTRKAFGKALSEDDPNVDTIRSQNAEARTPSHLRSIEDEPLRAENTNQPLNSSDKNKEVEGASVPSPQKPPSLQKSLSCHPKDLLARKPSVSQPTGSRPSSPLPSQPSAVLKSSEPPPLQRQHSSVLESSSPPQNSEISREDSTASQLSPPTQKTQSVEGSPFPPPIESSSSQTHKRQYFPPRDSSFVERGETTELSSDEV